MKAEGWFRAAEENLHGHLLSLAQCPGSRSLVRPYLELFDFGGADIPEFNLAYLKRKDGLVLDEALETCRAFFSHPGRRYITNAPGLEPELIRRGWQEEDPFQAMHLDLSRIPQQAEASAEIKIRSVEDEEGMDDLASVLCSSWNISPTHWDGVFEVLRGIEIGARSAFRGHVLYASGHPISSLLIFTQGKIAGVQLVSTLPAQRGRGWASRLLVEALQVARDGGATDSVLEATRMGAGSYERLGFEGCGWSRYLSPPQRHNAD